MNYLKNFERRVRNKINRKSKIATPEVEEAETITKPKPKATSNDNWEAEWERILDELKGGNKDGKA
jgi:hydroxymethylpyrimidine/phosphomethylpyrimidine kinase